MTLEVSWIGLDKVGRDISRLGLDKVGRYHGKDVIRSDKLGYSSEISLKGKRWVGPRPHCLIT